MVTYLEETGSAPFHVMVPSETAGLLFHVNELDDL